MPLTQFNMTTLFTYISTYIFTHISTYILLLLCIFIESYFEPGSVTGWDTPYSCGTNRWYVHKCLTSCLEKK